MTLPLGTVKPGSTIYVPFHAFDSNDPSASTTISGFALADIKVYKNGGTTERASTAGFTLLDTDGIDFDANTGLNGFSIDLSDNTTASFWEAGAQYMVGVGEITVDAATVNMWAATFEIGYPGAQINTTIDTLASQISFTLPSGEAPGDDDALNGWTGIVHDIASAVQHCDVVVEDYTGSTRTLTLSVDPAVFTMAAGDNISLFRPVGISAINGSALRGDGSTGDKFDSVNT